MKKVIFLCLFFIGHVYAFDLGTITNAFTNSTEESKQVTAQESSSLIGLLGSSLGVSQTQAIGGASAILGKAASNMSSSDVSALSSKIPSISSMLTGSSQTSNMLGALASSTSLSSQFSALGMDSGMVAQFIPVILEFINSNAGSSLMQSVQNALK
jgi:hypothetical protein